MSGLINDLLEEHFKNSEIKKDPSKRLEQIELEKKSAIEILEKEKEIIIEKAKEEEMKAEASEEEKKMHREKVEQEAENMRIEMIVDAYGREGCEISFEEAQEIRKAGIYNIDLDFVKKLREKKDIKEGG